MQQHPIIQLIEHDEDCIEDMIADVPEEKQYKTNLNLCKSLKEKFENGLQLSTEEADYLDHILDSHVRNLFTY